MIFMTHFPDMGLARGRNHGLRTPRESFFSKIPKPHSKLCQTQFLRIRSSIEIQDTHSQQKSHFQKIYRPHQNLICSCNFLQPNHGLRTPRESFFSKIKNFWAWADKLGWNFRRHLGYFWPNYKHYFGTLSPLSMGKCSWFSFLQNTLVFRSKTYNSQMLPK